MARSEEDSVSQDASHNSNNPFSRFRRAADEKISTLLQGIIGLPSALTRIPAGNTRWADFDGDLRRRDELQARQKDLKESEAKRSKTDEHGQTNVGDIDLNVVDIRVPPMPLRPLSSFSDIDMNAFRMHLPLYSIGTRGLLADLGPHGNGRSGWSQLKPLETTTGSDPLATLRHDVFLGRHLDPSDRGGYPVKDSTHSLLPYLLFSPYSPLKLSASSSSNSPPEDKFPYCHAFEDLIRVSQGDEMVSAMKRKYFYQPFYLPTHFMAWIKDLDTDGLLSHPTHPQVSKAFNASKPMWPDKHHKLDTEPKEGNAQTEEDMYGRFLRSSSASSNNEVDLGLFFDSLFTDIGKGFQEFPIVDQQVFQAFLDEVILGSSERSKTVRSMAELLWEYIDSSSGQKDATKAIRGVSELILQTLPGTEIVRVKRESPTEQTSDHAIEKNVVALSSLMLRDLPHLPAKDKIVTTKTESKTKADLGNKADSASKFEKIVSSSTTSEHTTNEDGSIETSVTVWKRFADGRETVTTTSHIEDPRKDEDGKSVQTSSVESAQEADTSKDVKEKKGWFWN